MALFPDSTDSSTEIFRNLQICRTDEPPDERNTHVVDPNGDLLLQIKGEEGDLLHYFRVSSALLQRSSPYFANLLDPRKFSEGANFNARRAELDKCYPNTTSIPFVDLPVICIIDSGHYTKNLSFKEGMANFLSLLHGLPLVWKSFKVKRFLDEASMLASIADRFSTDLRVASSISEPHHWTQIGKVALDSRGDFSPKDKEIMWRQRVFVGLQLGLDEWVASYSKALIETGSERWTIAKNSDNKNKYLEPWWFLPGGVEEELAHRRQCVLETVSSIQDFFVRRYTSTERKCKLGYDSSPQCDSFQLGETIKFFTKKGTLDFLSTIVDSENVQPYTGSVDRLLTTWRECPSYQIDHNHSHCGLRTNLLPAVEILEVLLRSPKVLGLCLFCWRRNKREHSWIESPDEGCWIYKRDDKMTMLTHANEHRHGHGKAVFTAEDRIWMPEK